MRTEHRPLQIKESHLDRKAIGYCRQSTERQLEENRGSTADQRAQVDYARTWGWREELIETIDQDLGLSGTAAAHRPGYLRLREQVRAGRVGLVLVSDLSRLGRDAVELWTFVDDCIAHDTLIAISGKIEDLGDSTHVLTQRVISSVVEFENVRRREAMQRGLDAKLREGIAVTRPPAGYVWGPNRAWVPDPEQLVQDAIRAVFRLFLRHRSLIPTVRALREENIRIPRRGKNGVLRWVEPQVFQVYDIVTRRAYRGDYVFGRKRIVPGKARTRGGRRLTRRATDEEIIVLRDHHWPYVTQAEWDEVQTILKTNAPTQDWRNLGPGPALVQGVIRCEMHGNMAMSAHYHSRQQNLRSCHSYQCRGESEGGGAACGSISGFFVDRAVADAAIARLQPPRLAVVREAWQRGHADELGAQRRRRSELARARQAVEDAKYRALAVDPTLTSVAAELNTMWEQAKRNLQRLEDQEDQSPSGIVGFTDDIWNELIQVAQDIPAVWNAPTTADRDRKEIIRLMIRMVIFEGRTRDELQIRILWADGAADTTIEIKLASHAHTVISDLAAQGVELNDIVRQLNEAGLLTLQGNPWTRPAVAQLLRGRKEKKRSAEQAA